MTNIDIETICTYFNGEIEKFNIDNLKCEKIDDKYRAYNSTEELIIELKEKYFSIEKNKDMIYKKKYELNKKHKSILKIGEYEIITYIKTNVFEKTESNIKISAEEFDENDILIQNIDINIEIRR